MHCRSGAKLCRHCRLPWVQLQGIGTVPSNTASPASNHPRPDAPVPVLVAGDYSTRVQVKYIRKYVTAEECAINSGVAKGSEGQAPPGAKVGGRQNEKEF